MRTGTGSSLGIHGSSPLTRPGLAGGLVAVLLCVFCSSVQAQSGTMGFANYKNRWIRVTSSPAAKASTSTLSWNGHAGPYAAPQSGDVPAIPAAGYYRLRRSAIGHPISGAAFFGPDYYIGERIQPPEDALSPLTGSPKIEPPTSAFYVGIARNVYAGDAGPVTISWRKTDGTTHTIQYVISNQPVEEPKRIYHTEGATDKGGLVDLTPAPTLVIHYNTQIRSNSDLWVDGQKRLHAANRSGLVAAHWNLGGTFDGIIVIDVRNYVPDAITSNHNVAGDVLEPDDTPAGMIATPTISRGDEEPRPYVFQYDTDKDPSIREQVVPVRPTSANNQIYLYWKKTGNYGEIWPYELHAYQTRWDPAVTDWQRIYYTADGTLGPTVNCAGVDFLRLYYNDRVTSTVTVYINTNPRAIYATGGLAETGKILLRMDTSTATGPSVFEFVEVFDYIPDYVTPLNVGDQLLPTRVVADPLQPDTYVRNTWNGNPTDPSNYVYQHNVIGPYKGAAFAVRPTTLETQIELFFKRMGQMGLKWPYEMHRYTATWPAGAQLYVRGTNAAVPGPRVPIPKNLNATLMPYQEFVPQTGSPSQVQHAELNGSQFYSDLVGKTVGDYYAVLQYQTGPTNSPGSEWVGFQVVKCVQNTDTRHFNRLLHAWEIGTEITSATYHRGPAPGFIYHLLGVDNEDKYDPRIYNEGGLGYATGQIFPVFPGQMEVWWYNLTTHGSTSGSTYTIQWPSRVMRYDCTWPASPEEMTIESQAGSGQIPFAHRNPEIYYENDPTRIGYNPNCEHAALFPYGSGIAAFALRCDLNAESTDKPVPYVLVKYQDSTDRDLWRFRVFHVSAGNVIRLNARAGSVVPKPYPLAALQPDCGETTPGLHNGNYGVSGPYWQDRNLTFWARAAADDGGTSEIVMRYWYPVQPGFVFPNPVDRAKYPVGSRTPWLNKLQVPYDTPADVVYTVSWPPLIPSLKTGETLVVPKFGLPAIMGQMSVERIYESLNHNTTGSIPGQRNIMLIDPLRERSVSLNSLPTGADSIETENRAGKLYFSGLPPQLRTRVSYDPINKKLALVGEFYDMLGEDILLINVLTIRDRAFLDALSANQAFRDAVNALYELTSGPIILTGADSNSVGKAVVGVSALNPNASPTTSAYVTLVMQNHPSCGALPVSLEVIRVEDSLYRGEIKVIEPDCCFDEKLTLRHSGDFAGKADQYIFKWEYHPDMDGLPPATGSPLWRSYPAEPVDGVGALDVTIRGPGLFTLSDNWFRVQYRLRTDPDTSPSYSRLTNPQLAPGWIKRVIGQINPFTQRASGGGIQGAEQRFSQFQTRTVNTVVSMIEQAGKRWVGNVPMNCGPGLDALGLIEIYDTVLGRGKQLSIDAGYSYPPANNALLLAAGRIADLYMLVGNEAYADAADPTIAFGTEDGIYGTEASSIHCFMNQTASLLEEELALLRGRDNSLAPGVQVDPLYNRLMWNFTRDINGGEVAYALNYNIQDALGNADGTINELDAMRLYPQGHGDAWGHYLTAIKRYYALLKHPNFDWVPRAEAVLVGGQPVTVDYLDERKFAKAAAAKAQTGAEIVNLTYRQAYVEDPAGQWQGYKDGNSDRGWGLSEWASRAGQGAYFDWLVANAILPSSDTLHTGIQKIDRTTVAELREIASAFGDVKQQMINADIGLNPLGLAKNVVPFDIDPAKVLMEGSSQTHFEQIYDRAIMALNNAVTVFDHATNCTQLLRRQSDKQTEFQNKVTDQESDFKSRLIEVFGYPYAGDIGAGKTYPQGYDGPDLYHYDYANVSELLGRDREPTQMFTMQLADFGEGNVDDTGNVTSTTKEISFHISMTGFGLCPPEGEDWGQRRAPGEIQRIRAQLIQLYGQFQKTRIDYANVLRDIQVRSDRIDERIKLKTDKISVRTKTRNEVASFAAIKIAAHEVELCVKRAADSGVQVMQSVNEAVPKSFIAGLAAGGDVTAPIRGVTQTVAVAGATALNITGDIAEMVQASMDLAKEAVQSKQEIDLLELDENKEIHQMLVDLTVKLSDEQSKRLELFMLIEQMSQMAGEYAAALAKGLRILDGRTRFRIQTASQVQSYRYKDMAFRIFRNDALQKYRAQFDMAARYVYLAAKAYDYETNLLDQDRRAGEFFMTNIIRARAIGSVIDSVPRTGSGLGDPGLADILARMKLNWDLALKGQLGFNNPQTETNRFSLRMELFRSVTTDTWRTVLRQYRVDDILTIPEFKRYCRVFQPHETTEPGIVIPVSTTVNFGFNFFGEKLAAGDSAYDSTNFATKVRSVGVWFTGYDALTSYGLSNTPRVYLIPVGYDIMRSPTGETGEIRLWKILDQKMPIPFPVGPSDLASPSWIPMVDTLSEEYAAIRKFSSFRAYHDSGEFSLSETITDSRLIGRSVWNTRWLLIIPAGTLHSNRQMGLDTFINGVTDIKMFFSTYAYSGN